MAEEKFKLPRSSYEELCKIIKAYGTLNKPIPLNEITRATGINRTIVSSNNAFLSNVGIIEGGILKGVTGTGKSLAQALEYGLPKEIAAAWQVVIRGNDFLNKMVLAVRIRKGMESSSLEAHIAYSAGLPKKEAVMTGARTIIDILLNSGMVTEKDDRIIPVEGPISASEEKTVPPEIRNSATEVFNLSGVNLNINVSINVVPSELEGLGERVKVLIEELLDIGKKRKKDAEDAEQEG